MFFLNDHFFFFQHFFQTYKYFIFEIFPFLKKTEVIKNERGKNLENLELILFLF